MWLQELQSDGCCVVPNLADEAQIGGLLASIEPRLATGRSTHALRNLHDVPRVAEFASSARIRDIVERVLGIGARMVRGIYFDKTPDANWKVAWHQDLSIAVREQRDVAGFGPWSRKEGVVHVQPPPHVLENMLTLRLHLDDCGEESGPLRVIPGSHAAGILTDAEIERRVRDGPQRVCTVPRGGAVLMRPLILHGSSPATHPAHRRVIHLEFAAGALPSGLQWHVR
jgi:ectoine hydroxylase-related dioxygenase (phytanoyl-CoA dioxygenase family)